MEFRTFAITLTTTASIVSFWRRALDAATDALRTEQSPSKQRGNEQMPYLWFRDHPSGQFPCANKAKCLPHFNCHIHWPDRNPSLSSCHIEPGKKPPVSTISIKLNDNPKVARNDRPGYRLPGDLRPYFARCREPSLLPSELGICCFFFLDCYFVAFPPHAVLTKRKKKRNWITRDRNGTGWIVGIICIERMIVGSCEKSNAWKVMLHGTIFDASLSREKSISCIMTIKSFASNVVRIWSLFKVVQHAAGNLPPSAFVHHIYPCGRLGASCLPRGPWSQWWYLESGYPSRDGLHLSSKSNNLFLPRLSLRKKKIVRR